MYEAFMLMRLAGFAFKKRLPMSSSKISPLLPSSVLCGSFSSRLFLFRAFFPMYDLSLHFFRDAA
jgi:hypothetical protein